MTITPSICVGAVKTKALGMDTGLGSIKNGLLRNIVTAVTREHTNQTKTTMRRHSEWGNEFVRALMPNDSEPLCMESCLGRIKHATPRSNV